MECSDVLATTHVVYRKGPGTCGALSCLSHTFQRALETG